MQTRHKWMGCQEALYLEGSGPLQKVTGMLWNKIDKFSWTITLVKISFDYPAVATLLLSSVVGMINAQNRA